MHPVLEQLQKILKHETNSGHLNKAVIGGLPKMLVFWEPNARRAGLNAAFVDAVVERLRAYPDLPETERPAAIQAILKMVMEAAATAPAATPRAFEGRPAASQRGDISSAGKGALPQLPGHAAAPPAGGAEKAQAPTSRPEPSAPPPPPVPPLIPSASGMPTDSFPPAPVVNGPPTTLSPRPPSPLPSAQSGPREAVDQRPPPPGVGQSPAAPPRRTRYGESVYQGEEPLDPRPRRSAGPRPLRSPVPVNVNAGVDAPLTVLRGVGPEYARVFERLGLNTLRDLLLHFPRRYDNYSRMKTINRLEYGEECSVIATVSEARLRRTRGGQSTVLNVVLSDTTGMLEVSFFNQPYLADKLKPGRQIVISGRISQYLGRVTIVPDEWEDLDREMLNTGRIVPVYPLTEGVRQRMMRRLTAQVVEYWASRQPDPLPSEIVTRAGLLTYGAALAQIHWPESEARLEAARHRLAFDELLLLQLGVLRQRREWQASQGTPRLVPDEWLQSFLATLPYGLTGAQQRALADIREDLGRSVPMNRLLQGDVGSGKTVVAAAAMAMVMQADAQAAIMAPTSILAEQHYQTLSALLQPAFRLHPSALRLLQGSTPAADKDAIYAGLRSGEIRVVVGTHALIEAPVEFADLGLAVVDEQHRFGVSQRAALRGKGQALGRGPHLLVMTATPIPRSLALTVYGDLDLSVLDEMPPGRRPIQTHLLHAKERERGYAFIRSQVQKGRQAFIIFPLVEESEKIEARAAVEEHQRLQTQVFPEFKLGLLHGRMRPDEKDEVMARFRAGDYQALVSTSVVEVGVDVPNATVMLVEGANRFGLAQLHQFRGRVGRGEHASYCLLVSDAPNPRADERLLALEQSQDGFYLAEKDLELRGPGDFLGTRQAGFADLEMARLSDVKTIETARREARWIFEHDPELQAPEHQLLAEWMARFWAPGAGDVS